MKPKQKLSQLPTWRTERLSTANENLRWKQPNYLKRGKTRATKSWVVSVASDWLRTWHEFSGSIIERKSKTNAILNYFRLSIENCLVLNGVFGRWKLLPIDWDRTRINQKEIRTFKERNCLKRLEMENLEKNFTEF